MRHHFYTIFFAIVCFFAALNARAASILPELEGKALGLTLPWAAQIETGRWYVMYNIGRKGFLYDDETKLYISTAPPAPNAMQYLVRIVEDGNRKVVQTGRGRYFTTLSTSNNSGTTTTHLSKNAYTYGTIAEGYFWLKDNNGMVLDANALGSAIDAKSTVAGWGKDTPTSTTGNNSWRFFPVELTDALDEFDVVPHSFGNYAFESVENGRYLYYDAHNLGLLNMDSDEEGRDVPMGSVLLNGDGLWTLGVPEGTGGNTNFHIGTDGKFSAGPASLCRLYHALTTEEGEYTFKEVASINDGATYLIVSNYEGHDYALCNVISNAGTANQRVLSSKVTFAPNMIEGAEEGEPAVSDGTLKATFTGANASNVVGHLWRFHYGESLIQDPFVYKSGETGGASGNGAPLLTIACVSDIHTQEGWLSGTAWTDQDNALRETMEMKNVKVRESLAEAMKALKTEGVDVLIVGGDCQSDATVDEEHWRQVRRLMSDALRGANASKKAGAADDPDIPVLYVNGNHEYEVASTWGGNGRGYYNWRYTRPFNAGEYYDYPMSKDVGVLANGFDCFYENASNDGNAAARKSMPVLAAYHYNIKGFDFLVLNCGKHLFMNANNYSYSDESVEWVGSKLQQIYADDPSHTKTVFFALHIPFGDSNSINTSEDKGMSYYASTRRLKEILAQYPGLVMLYGHDHGQDLAYIRSKTSQRMTRYDSNGNVMATGDGVEMFDKSLSASALSKPIPYKGQSVMFHPYADKVTTCLGIKGTFLNGSATVQRSLALLSYDSYCTLFAENDGGVSLRLGDGSEHLVFNNGFGLSSAEHQSLSLYHVTIDGPSFSVTRVQEVVDGEIYLIGSPSSIFRVGNQRAFKPQTESFSVATYSSFFWRAELPKQAVPSFISSFMGSMRYYNNSIGEPGNATQNKRKLIQGLLIYVYPDRIVFNMKNFRNNAQNRVRNELTPYVVKRSLPEVADEAIVKHNPSGAYYRRIDDLSQLTPGSVCVFVDEARGRSFGNVNNTTNKFGTVIVTPSEDGRLELSRNTMECEFVFEKEATGAPTLPGDSHTWYLRSHDGYIKMAETNIFHRQQAQNFYVSNPLANEAVNAAIVPWNITLNEAGEATAENEALGRLRKFTTGMTTGTFHLYQKVVPAAIDEATGLGVFYSEYALGIPADVEAFTIDGLSEQGTLHFVRQAAKVPAKTGLVLRAHHSEAAPNRASSFAAAADGGVVVEIPVVDDRYALPLTNRLCGTLSTILTPASTEEVSYYRLEMKSDTSSAPAFVLANGTGDPFVNPCGDSYLVLSSAEAALHSGAPSVALDALLDAADTDGIHDIVLPGTQAADAAIYTLAGQRVSTAAHGIPARPGLYIVGGKKMIVGAR